MRQKVKRLMELEVFVCNIGSFSWRAWGDLMAAIWSEEEDKDYSYMDFYM